MIPEDSAAPSPAPATSRTRVRRRLRSAQEIRDRRRRILTTVACTCAFVLMVHALVGENGYVATIRAEREYAEVTAALAAQREENDRLLTRLHRLKTDPAELEAAARRQLGLIRPGETLVIIRDLRTNPGGVQK